MNKVRAIALLMVLLALTACNHAGEYLDVARDKGISKAYFEVLNRWTRKETLYSQFETKVQITATFKNKP